MVFSDNYLKNKYTYAITSDSEYEYFLIGNENPSEFMGSFWDIGKCYKGNTLGEFLVYDFDDIHYMYDYILENCHNSEDVFKFVLEYYRSQCNPNGDFPWNTFSHVNLFLFDYIVKMLNIACENRESDCFPKDAINIDLLISEYKSLQDYCSTIMRDILEIPKHSNLYKCYIKRINRNTISPLNYSGSFTLQYEEARNGLFRNNNAASESYTEWFIPNSCKDLLVYMISRYISKDIHFKTCKFCERKFGLIKRYNSDFCNRPIYDRGDYENPIDDKLNEEIRTCRNYGRLIYYNYVNTPDIIYKVSASQEITNEYTKAYKTHHARLRSKNESIKMTKDEFNKWVAEAQEQRDKCFRGEISTDEFYEWLNKDKLRKPKTKKRAD